MRYVVTINVNEMCEIENFVLGYENLENWHGRWFPYGPGQKDDNPGETEEQFRAMMPVRPSCDDGKVI